MKNIVVIGSPRSGKTTFARELCKRDKRFNLISSDDLRATFMNVIPELEINDKGGEGTKTRYPYFIKYFLDRTIKINKYGFYYIIEGDFSYYEQAKELFYNDDTILIFIGKPELNKEELLMNIRKYDINPKVWTHRFNDEQLIKQCDSFTKKSRENKEKCDRDGLIFIDTSFNHEEVINNYVNRILNGEFD